MLKGENVSVALSVMTNPGVLRAFEHLGVNVYETPVGDAYLFEAIKNQYATIGAEASGHYMLSFDNGVEHVLIGDGMLAAKKIIDIMSRYGIDVVKLWLEEISMVPMTTKNLHLDRTCLDRDDIKECIEQLKKHVIPPYKVIVRPSGTEDKIRLTVSLPTQKEVNNMLDQLTRCLERG
jgi:phosphoglucosamine mutase